MSLPLPSYRRHKPTGPAVVTVRTPGGGRRNQYLSRHGSAASKAEYRRVLQHGMYLAPGTDLNVDEVLLAYLKWATAQAEAERLAARAAERATPRYASHMRRNERTRKGDARTRKPGERYTTASYRQAIERACGKAGVLAFTPHRLRHLAATEVRQAFGVDVARARLGHSLAAVTEIYSREADKALALKAVEAMG